MTEFIHTLSGINAKIHEETLRNKLKNKYYELIHAALANK
jgi:hypothetical protein